LFRVLPGLPAVGKPAISFSPDGTALHAEGLVVDFDGRWQGNFAKGKTGHDAVFAQFAPDYVHVISGGNYYIVDVVDRLADPVARDWIGASIFSRAANAVIVFDLMHAIAYQGRRRLWESERIAWDGVRGVSEVGAEIHGKSYDPFGDTWIDFKLDPVTGKHAGGGYPS
jgi:hypothetical protein